MHQYRWPVPAKYLLRRPDGDGGPWTRASSTSYRARHTAAVVSILANAAGLLPSELDVIVDRLVASGRIERNRRLTGGRPIERIE